MTNLVKVNRLNKEICTYNMISVAKYHNGNIETEVELNLASSNSLTLQQNIASHLHKTN